MKKFTIAVTAFASLSFTIPISAIVPAYALTSQQAKVNQSILKQVDSLQSLVNKEHNTYFKNQIHKSLITCRMNLTQDQAARNIASSSMSSYEYSVKKYKGHDKGTIAKTLVQVNHILASIRNVIDDNQKPEQQSFRTVLVDIQKNKLQQALVDIRKADTHAVNETNVLEKAAKQLNQIAHEIRVAGSEK